MSLSDREVMEELESWKGFGDVLFVQHKRIARLTSETEELRKKKEV